MKQFKHGCTNRLGERIFRQKVLIRDLLVLGSYVHRSSCVGTHLHEGPLIFSKLLRVVGDLNSGHRIIS